MWNLKYDTSELIFMKQIDSRGQGRDILGVWDW